MNRSPNLWKCFVRLISKIEYGLRNASIPLGFMIKWVDQNPIHLVTEKADSHIKISLEINYFKNDEKRIYIQLTDYECIGRS